MFVVEWTGYRRLYVVKPMWTVASWLSRTGLYPGNPVTTLMVCSPRFHERTDLLSRGLLCCAACPCCQGAVKADTWKDNWTVVAKDGGFAAQFEHTLLITPNGVEILTKV